MSASVEVKLYNNSSDPFVVFKKITHVATVTAQFTESTAIDTPELLLDMQTNIKNFNYAYIETFGRYYFCKPQIENGNQMRLVCESDPLSSFWSDGVSSSSCIAERSTSDINPDLVDDMLPFKPNPRLQFATIGGGFTPSSSGGCYILTVGGK